MAKTEWKARARAGQGRDGQGNIGHRKVPNDTALKGQGHGEIQLRAGQE